MLRLLDIFKEYQRINWTPCDEELRLAANMEPRDPNQRAIIISKLQSVSVGLIISDEIEDGIKVCSQLWYETCESNSEIFTRQNHGIRQSTKSSLRSGL